METEKSVGAIVVSERGKYLLLDRSAIKGVPVKGSFWEFSKGHVEGEETEMTTLTREIWEECGIAEYTPIEGFREEYSYASSSGNLRLFVFYLIKIPDDRIVLSEEHKDYKWVTLEEAKGMLPNESWWDILSKADEFIRLHSPSAKA